MGWRCGVIRRATCDERRADCGEGRCKRQITAGHCGRQGGYRVRTAWCEDRCREGDQALSAGSCRSAHMICTEASGTRNWCVGVSVHHGMPTAILRCWSRCLSTVKVRRRLALPTHHDLSFDPATTSSHLILLHIFVKLHRDPQLIEAIERSEDREIDQSAAILTQK